ncbi:MAG: aldehyde dehydrogenase family protein [Candidatus Melainabacteria bacterium]|nr:MAG: aldehyde dehydrogenase family protein [Candidatus Melainabacteria bacterium]
MSTVTETRFGLSSEQSAIHIGNRATKAHGAKLEVRSPIDGELMATLQIASSKDVTAVVEAANKAFQFWRNVPAPVRGEFVRRIGEKARERKAQLAEILSNEVGKTTQEALGEIQEFIDVCDFAVGLSRQLHGLTIASERPAHRMMEQWHPLGPIGVITAFNFPVAVWAWNAMLAFVCGDSVIWKPSEKAPLCAFACQQVVNDVISEFDVVDLKNVALSNIVVGLADVGEAIASSPEIPLISATGSTRMGIAVAQTVAKRLGRSLLELGGNNAMIVTPTADLEMAMRAIVFAAVGTAGQRCTTLRRLIVHKSQADALVSKLKKVYSNLPIGDPREPGKLIGPLIDKAAFDQMQNALAKAKAEGGKVFGGERVEKGVPANGYYVSPALVEISSQTEIVQHETFAPILYVMTYENFDDAVALQNGVPQGLSSAIFTSDMREAELFMSPSGSDCGIANVNIGTSGAEIGGAFGGEKQTGGGRESGSDSWKNYMRRTTNTINYSKELPLAQGIKFDV